MKDIDRYKCGCSYKGRCGEGGRLGGKEGDRTETERERNVCRKKHRQEKSGHRQAPRRTISKEQRLSKKFPSYQGKKISLKDDGFAMKQGILCVSHSPLF